MLPEPPPVLSVVVVPLYFILFFFFVVVYFFLFIKPERSIFYFSSSPPFPSRPPPPPPHFPLPLGEAAPLPSPQSLGGDPFSAPLFQLPPVCPPILPPQGRIVNIGAIWVYFGGVEAPLPRRGMGPRGLGWVHGGVGEGARYMLPGVCRVPPPLFF